MRRIIAIATAITALFAGAVATADNTHGHCTAYFNGSENGQTHKRQSNAFQEFATEIGENDGVDNDGDDETDEAGEQATPADIWDWCLDTENNPKGIGGNPDDPNKEGDTNGRTKP
jgi:hypothetical protein